MFIAYDGPLAYFIFPLRLFQTLLLLFSGQFSFLHSVVDDPRCVSFLRLVFPCGKTEEKEEEASEETKQAHVGTGAREEAGLADGGRASERESRREKRLSRAK